MSRGSDRPVCIGAIVVEAGEGGYAAVTGREQSAFVRTFASWPWQLHRMRVDVRLGIAIAAWVV